MGKVKLIFNPMSDRGRSGQRASDPYELQKILIAVRASHKNNILAHQINLVIHSDPVIFFRTGKSHSLDMPEISYAELLRNELCEVLGRFS